MKWLSFFRGRSKPVVLNASTLDEPYSDTLRDIIVSVQDWSNLPLLSYYTSWTKTLLPLATREQILSIRVDPSSFLISDLYKDLAADNVSYETIYTIASKLIDCLPMPVLLKPYQTGHRQYSFGCFHPSLMLKLFERARRDVLDRDVAVKADYILRRSFLFTSYYYLPRAYLEYPLDIQDLKTVADHVRVALTKGHFLVALELCAADSNNSYTALSKSKLDSILDFELFPEVFNTFSPSYIGRDAFHKFMATYESYFSNDEKYLLYWRCQCESPALNPDTPGLGLLLDLMDRSITWENIKVLLHQHAQPMLEIPLTSSTLE